MLDRETLLHTPTMPPTATRQLDKPDSSTTVSHILVDYIVYNDEILTLKVDNPVINKLSGLL